MSSGDFCGVLVQYPATDGSLDNYGTFVKDAHAAGAKVVMATDHLGVTSLKPPGDIGADLTLGVSVCQWDTVVLTRLSSLPERNTKDKSLGVFRCDSRCPRTSSSYGYANPKSC